MTAKLRRLAPNLSFDAGILHARLHQREVPVRMQNLERRSRRAVDVLIVDNDRDTSDTLADLLTSAGYRVSLADSGLDALEFINRNPAPRLILLDLLMPGNMGGVEFLSYREGSKWEKVPVILLSDLCTAAPLPGWVEQVLNRPIDLYKLLAAVRKSLNS